MIIVDRQVSCFTAISWREQVIFLCVDDDVRIKLSQYAQLDLQ